MYEVISIFHNHVSVSLASCTRSIPFTFLSQTPNILGYSTLKFPNFCSANAEMMFRKDPDEIRRTSEDLCEFKRLP
jgi:hypothetical protein